MAEESGVYTKDQLELLDKKLNYMIYGQGFTVCVVDAKHTRRRTLVNLLKKIGVESIDEADDYEKTAAVLKKYPDDKIIIMTDLDLGKINGLRLITGLMLNHKGLCGIIFTDAPNPKLEQIIAVTKSIAVRVRPFNQEDIVALIEKLGFSVEKP